MKCPKCEKQNKPGVKNCEYCSEKMPVRKKRSSNSKVVVTEKKVAENKKSVTVKTKKVESKVIDENYKKEPLIELSDEKKAIKKMVKNIKKINKMIYVYILLVIAIFIMIIGVNTKLHTITCEANNNSETEKYNIKLVIKRNNQTITGFKYVTESITNSYDETLETRYNIIMDELEKKDKYAEIVKSNLTSRSMKIQYTFNERNLDKTSDYISIDLSPYLDKVDSFVKTLETEVGFSCK